MDDGGYPAGLDAVALRRHQHRRSAVDGAPRRTDGGGVATGAGEAGGEGACAGGDLGRGEEDGDYGRRVGRCAKSLTSLRYGDVHVCVCGGRAPQSCNLQPFRSHEIHTSGLILDAMHFIVYQWIM